jgi:hypothetical protein
MRDLVDLASPTGCDCRVSLGRQPSGECKCRSRDLHKHPSYVIPASQLPEPAVPIHARLGMLNRTRHDIPSHLVSLSLNGVLLARVTGVVYEIKSKPADLRGTPRPG